MLDFLGQGGGAGIGQFLPILLIIVVFYFFMIRPQAKKMKEQKKFIEGMQKGDTVITNSGILGKVSDIDTRFVTLLVDKSTSIKFEKSSISAQLTKTYQKAENEKGAEKS